MNIKLYLNNNEPLSSNNYKAKRKENKYEYKNGIFIFDLKFEYNDWYYYLIAYSKIIYIIYSN